MREFLWDNKTLKQACPDAKLYGVCTGNRICIDSRDIQQGDIFVVFKGANIDGHHYVYDALKKGATCAIIEQQPENMDNKNYLMLVPSTKTALKELAIFNRNRSTAKILGITGSVGKTSTKEALHLVCSVDGKSYCNIKNFNNDLGLSISLASMPIDTKYGIFELGMNHKGEIAELTKILKPHLALITKIAKVHIEYFKSLKDIVLAKGEIFLGMNDSGIVVLNGDDKYCSLLSELALNQGITNIYRFGENSKNESYVLKYKAAGNKENPNKIKAKIFKDEINYKIKAHGKHQALNSIAVLTVIKKLGIDLTTAIKTLSDFSNIEGRGKFLELKLGGKKILILDDSYNANPISIKAALNVMQEINSVKYLQRKIAVLGDMVELGNYAETAHKELLKPFEASDINKLITVGPLMKNLFDSVTPNKRFAHFSDHNEAKESILTLIKDGDCILFKGSHGTKIYEIVKYLREHAV